MDQKIVNSLVEKGFKIFPLTVDIVKDGPKAGKKDVRAPSNWQVPRLYKNEEWSDANAMGFLTGKINNRYVIDVDNIDPEEYLKTLGCPPEVMDTFCVKTRSGGMHLFYELPKDTLQLEGDGGTIPNQAGLYISGQKTSIDTRADGGFVIFPPTTLPDGSSYSVCRATPSKVLPQYWIDILLHKKTAPAVDPQAESTYGHPDPAVRAKKMDLLKVMIKDAVNCRVGDRSEYDYRMVSLGLRAGLNDAELTLLLNKVSSKAKEKRDDTYIKLTISKAKSAVTEQLEAMVKLNETVNHLDGRLVNIGSQRISASPVWRQEDAHGSRAYKYMIDYWMIQQHMKENNIYTATLRNDNKLLVQEVDHKIDKLADLKTFYLSYITFLIENKYTTTIEEVVGSMPFLYEYGPDMFHDVVQKNCLNKERVGGLYTRELLIDTDTRDEMKFYFSDFFVSVTEKGHTLHEYSDLHAGIYRQSVIPHNVGISTEEGDIADFIKKLCNNDSTRILNLRTALGYLMSRYNDPNRMRMVVICDQGDSISPVGGTGKSLLLSFVSLMRPAETVLIDGKGYDPDDKFSYQNVDENTSLIIFDDLRSNYDFERHFHSITGGLTVEEKYQKKVKLTKDKTPKITATTNYSITSMGAAANRRLAEYEIYGYFSPSNPPQKVYGKLFFDWNEKEWHQFFGYMLECARLYMQHGLLVPEKYEQLGERKKIDGTCDEWCEFTENYVDKNTWYPTETILTKFAAEYEHVEKRLKLSHKLMHTWLERTAKFSGMELLNTRISYDIGQRHSIALSDGKIPVKEFKRVASIFNLKGTGIVQQLNVTDLFGGDK